MDEVLLILRQGIIAICNIFPECISLPRTQEEVIGAIDSTHMKMQPPRGENAEVFRNRKGFSSSNCQVVCNEQLRINDVRREKETKKEEHSLQFTINYRFYLPHSRGRARKNIN
ncbi:hypothetical protein JTB14_032974 [Gonioctena quinquepunctata]|nr:hypothetical protein JTB14_032974 [Gonioctena quinquepunctata]